MTISSAINLPQFTKALVADLQALRAGKISVREARARADLAKQVLRSVHYVVLAQRFIEQNAKNIALPTRDASPEIIAPKRRKGARNGR